MTWARSSTVDVLPVDPIGEAVAEAVVEILEGASVELIYSPIDDASLPSLDDGSVASASGEGPPGWRVTFTVQLGGRISPLVSPDSAPMAAMLGALPAAALRTAGRLRPAEKTDESIAPAVHRAIRDLIIIEALSCLQAPSSDRAATTQLLADTVEFLVELSGSRVESHDLTHGVIITGALHDEPRLSFEYPIDLRSAKRAPLLFDGQRAVLVVDRGGRARTELQRHRLDRLAPEAKLEAIATELVASGSLVAEATRVLGGVGFFLRDDRTVWVFMDGQPLVVRRAEHWSAFPLELGASIDNMIGGESAARLVVQAAFIISAQRGGAILAIVDDPRELEGIVSHKDRYDLRNEFDPMGMRVETKLHHLIDAKELDAPTLARLATLDGATVLDRQGKLIAYGAIVTSTGSQDEGARTAAAKTLSKTAEVVLKISADGDITVFRHGETIATLLGASPDL